MLKFVTDWHKNEPQPATDSRASTSEETHREFLEYIEQSRTYQEDRMGEYRARFLIPVGEILEEMKARGVDIGNAESRCLRPVVVVSEIQDCAAKLGALSDKLPE